MDADRIAARIAECHDLLAGADEELCVVGSIGGLRYEMAGADAGSPFPSANPNRARWYAEPLDEVCIEEVVSRFDAHDVPLWFLHGYGERGRAELEDCCERYGMERFTGTGYPVLAHDLEGIDDARCELRIERLATVPASHSAMLAGPLHGAPALALAEQGRCHFHGAYDGDELVALAGVLLLREMAYLGWAITREDQRGRGAHSALIRARLRHAREHGCAAAITETIDLLQTSLGNLHHAGFRTVGHRLVMQHGED